MAALRSEEKVYQTPTLGGLSNNQNYSFRFNKSKFREVGTRIHKVKIS